MAGNQIERSYVAGNVVPARAADTRTVAEAASAFSAPYGPGGFTGWRGCCIRRFAGRAVSSAVSIGSQRMLRRTRSARRR